MQYKKIFGLDDRYVSIGVAIGKFHSLHSSRGRDKNTQKYLQLRPTREALALQIKKYNN